MVYLLPTHVGKRVLLRRPHSQYQYGLEEVQVLERAPSGDYYKVKYASGNERWIEEEDYEVVEILRPAPAAPVLGQKHRKKKP